MSYLTKGLCLFVSNDLDPVLTLFSISSTWANICVQCIRACNARFFFFIRCMFMISFGCSHFLGLKGILLGEIGFMFNNFCHKQQFNTPYSVTTKIPAFCIVAILFVRLILKCICVKMANCKLHFKRILA